MKNTKKTILFLIAIFIMMVMPQSVKASPTYGYVKDNCIDKGECILLCNYYQKYNDVTYSIEKNQNISIFYYPKAKKWGIDYDTPSFNDSLDRDNYWVFKTIKPNSYEKVFTEPVYMIPSNNNSEFSCPKYGYLDTSKWSLKTEICFDNDGTSCTKKYNNAGTEFKHKRNKDYDFEDDIKVYLEKWSFGDIKCEEIYDGTFDVNNSNLLKEKFNNDFKNYLKVTSVPEFMTNTDSFKNIEARAEKSIKSKIEQCKNQIATNKENGTTSEEEAKKQEEILNNINPEQVAEIFAKTVEDILAEIDIEDSLIECDGIFGFEEGNVGWLIQKILNYIRIIGPILVVVLSSVDFIQAVFSSDEKAMKKAQSKLTIRLICAIALFLIPTLVNLALHLINGISDPNCGFY